ncbi:MAG: helix-turn-helix domain-containing protein [Bacteroidota bacterium]
MTPDQIVTKADLVQLEERLAQLINQNNNPQGTPFDKYLRSKDVENLLGISSSTLQNLRDSNSIPFTQLGKTYFYPQKEILEILQKNTQIPNKPFSF